jgi:ABC-type glycerol-3-phosphate transport system substrate-binding protein
MDGGARRTTRRGLLEGAAAAGLAGIALARPAAAAPLRANPVIALTFAPWWIYWNPAGEGLLREAAAEFDRTHPGLRLTAVQGPQGGSISSAGMITACLSGQGPDVVGDCCEAYTIYVSSGVFANLTPYLRRENIPLTTWNTGHVQALAEPEGQFALPLYDGPIVYMYNKTILDQLGLPYPDPDWDDKAAAALWRQCTGTIANVKSGSNHRYGVCFWWYPGYYTPGDWLFKGFGGSVLDASGTRCLLDQPPAIQAGEWIMPQIWDQVGTQNFNYSDIENGITVFSPRGGWYIARDVAAFGNKFEWDYVPVPYFPNGRATFGNNDFWGLNAYSPHRDAAWEVLKWLTYEDYWQRFTMKTAMLGPSKVSLWDEFETILTQTAPILRTKQIKWYKDAVQHGYGYAQKFFRYQPSQAFAIINNVMSELDAHKLDVIAAFTQITKQINALEATGPAIAAAQSAELAAVRKFVAKAEASVTPVAFPKPPRVEPGAGNPPVATTWVAVGPGGQVRLQAQGGGGVEGTADHITFAGAPFALSRGEFVCRLLSVLLPKGGALHQYTTAKVGLMARSSLSDGAADAAVAYAAYRGVHTVSRPLIGVNSAGAGSGIASAAVQVSATPAAGANWLVKPLWLRLNVDGNVWTAYASFDGKTWTAVAKPMTVEFVGAWVGLFATSANTGQTLEAVFDQVTGFSPSTHVRIGSL